MKRPILKRGEYWVLSLLDPDGKPIGNTWGGIVAKAFEVPPTLAFKNRSPGVYESAEDGVVIYRQPNPA